MANKTWAHCVRDARLIFLNRDKFAYLLYANGEHPKTYAEAKKLVDQFWSYDPYHFENSVIKTGHTREDLINHIIGKICYDCSGFVCAVTQSEGDIFDLKVVKDYNSTMMNNGVFQNVTTPADGVWGGVLWKTGHVALDVGNGLAIDFGNEFLDCREYRLSEGNFKKSGQLPWVDYTHAINL